MFAKDKENRLAQRLALVFVAAVAALLLAVATIRFYDRVSQKQIDVRFPVPADDATNANLEAGRKLRRNAPGQFMTLDPTGKFLINSVTQKPVFITGEAAWSLQVQLSDEDVEAYLSDRESRGFNLALVDLADNFYSNHPPKDFYGNAPFDGADFTSPNEAYWKRVDQTFRRAEAHGITIMADPAFVGYQCTGGYCPSYRSSSMETVAAYGQFLGNRYKSFPNLIWLIGGDADPADADGQRKLYALAKAVRAADPVHLITTEGMRGYSSIDVWNGAPWLDLNALYMKPSEIPAKASTDYKASPHPLFLLEDWYEGAKEINEAGVRKEGYWAVLSGCTIGRLFGNYAIWNFTWWQQTRDPWKDQLASEGSVGQSLLGKLLRSRAHWKLVPDTGHEVLTAGYDPRPWRERTKERARSWIYGDTFRTGERLAVAARTSDGQTIIVYIPDGRASVTIDMSKISDPQSQARSWWFNPRSGSTALVGVTTAHDLQNFQAPDANDWVLVIDSLAANLPAPGAAN